MHASRLIVLDQEFTAKPQTVKRLQGSPRVGFGNREAQRITRIYQESDQAISARDNTLKIGP